MSHKIFFFSEIAQTYYVAIRGGFSNTLLDSINVNGESAAAGRRPVASVSESDNSPALLMWLHLAAGRWDL